MATRPAALFDVDGTLVDSVYLHTETWQQALRQYGHHLPAAPVHRAVGLGGTQILDHLLGPDRDHGDDDAIKTAHDALYAARWPELEPLPGARRLLRACAERGWAVVLATSAKSRELAVLRRVLDVDEILAATVDADSVEAAKPAPDVVAQALREVGADAERSLFVGDTAWDVQSAARAGVRCLGVLTGGWSRAELAESGAVEVWEGPEDLADHLDGSALGGGAAD